MPLRGNISQTILDLFSKGHIRLTPGDLVREVRKGRPDQTRRDVRDATKTLVAQGRLIYTHHFSATHLELNFRQPVQVSERIFLLPANSRMVKKPECVGVKLIDGTVFGGGDHPTTRMALRGIDVVLAKYPTLKLRKQTRALDIGTGSGVLALAALKLGVAMAVGIDTDPMACDAARKNAALNKLSDRIEIGCHLSEENSRRAFDLVVINLRPPTLKQLFPKLTALSTPEAMWVISGFRVDEQNRLEKSVSDVGAQIIWQAEECNWAAWGIEFKDSSLRAPTTGS